MTLFALAAPPASLPEAISPSVYLELRHVAAMDRQQQRQWLQVMELRLDRATRMVLSAEQADAEKSRFYKLLRQDRVAQEVVLELMRTLDQREKEAINRLAREYRTEVYRTFRQQRDVEQRWQRWEEVFAAWKKAGGPFATRDRLLGWLRGAIDARGGSLAALPKAPSFAVARGETKPEPKPALVANSKPVREPKPEPQPPTRATPKPPLKPKVPKIEPLLAEWRETSSDSAPWWRRPMPLGLPPAPSIGRPQTHRQSPQPRPVGQPPSPPIRWPHTSFPLLAQTEPAANASPLPSMIQPGALPIERPGMSRETNPLELLAEHPIPRESVPVRVTVRRIVPDDALVEPSRSELPAPIPPLTDRPLPARSRDEPSWSGPPLPEPPQPASPSPTQLPEPLPAASSTDSGSAEVAVNLDELAAGIAGTNLQLRALEAELDLKEPWDAARLEPLLRKLRVCVVRHEDLALFLELVAPKQRRQVGRLEPPRPAITQMARCLFEARDRAAGDAFVGTPQQRAAELNRLDVISRQLAELTMEP